MDALQNRQAELAILGVAMQDRACAIELAALPEDTFAAPDTQAVHRAVKRLVKKNHTPEIVTLAAECRVDLAEPETLLMQAMTTGTGPAFYGQYAATLAEARKRRIVFQSASEAIKTVTDPSSSVDAIAAESIKVLQGADAQQRAIGMDQAVMKFMASLDAASDQRCNTGIAGLDRRTGGLRGGKLVILGARPGVGKTALALQMAVHVARNGRPVLIVSLEMDEEELLARIVAAESGVDVERIEAGTLSPEDIDRMSACYAEIMALPIRIATRATTPLQVRREAASMQNAGGLGMIVVDYIQLMRPDGKHSSRYEEVSAISRELKLLAMDLHVPVLALTQFNRQSEAGNGKAEKRAPTMAEAKDSGSIEQDANMFLIQYEPPEPKAVSGDPAWESWCACQMAGTTWQTLIIAKNRQGKTGVINMAFDKPHMRFTTIDLTRKEKVECQQRLAL
jgi:replicative DNA helicase